MSESDEEEGREKAPRTVKYPIPLSKQPALALDTFEAQG
jgi:hypothetical protein